jgi:hypothetical protein
LGPAAAACMIDDLTLVFGVISGVSECLIIFILPAIFYLKADKISKEKAFNKKKEVKGASVFTKLCVWLFGFIGVCYFCMSNYFNF